MISRRDILKVGAASIGALFFPAQIFAKNDEEYRLAKKLYETLQGDIQDVMLGKSKPISSDIGIFNNPNITYYYDILITGKDGKFAIAGFWWEDKKKDLKGHVIDSGLFDDVYSHDILFYNRSTDLSKYNINKFIQHCKNIFSQDGHPVVLKGSYVEKANEANSQSRV